MEENPKNNIHCIAISRNMLERILRIHYSDVCSIWVDKKSRYKRFDTINQKHPSCPGWQRFISLISVSSVLVTSSRRHRCVWFYKIGHTWTYCTIHYKRKWRGTFRSLIKISIYFGIDHPPPPPPDHTTVGVCFLGGSQVFAGLRSLHSETQGQSIRPGENALSSTFVATFLPTRLTATGSSRMRSLIGKHILLHKSYMYLSNTLFLPREIYVYMYSCEFKTRLQFVVWLLRDYYCYKLKVAGFWWSWKQ